MYHYTPSIISTNPYPSSTLTLHTTDDIIRAYNEAVAIWQAKGDTLENNFLYAEVVARLAKAGTICSMGEPTFSILSTQPVNTPYQYNLSIHPLNSTFQSTHHVGNASGTTGDEKKPGRLLLSHILITLQVKTNHPVTFRVDYFVNTLVA